MLEFIHILLVKVELGPYSERQVRQFLEAGHLLPTDLARYEPNKEWTPLSEVLANLPRPIVALPPILSRAPLSYAFEPAVVWIAPARPPLEALPIPWAIPSPDTIEPAVVLIAPAPAIIDAPPIPWDVPSPETLEPAVILVATAPPIPEPPPTLLEAPIVAEFVPATLQPTVILHSPLLPARQILPPTKAEPVAPKPAPGPTPITSTEPEVTPPAPPDPASQLLSPEKESNPVEDPKDETFPSSGGSKEREITPPPKPVVPYNQPIPRPGPSFVDHWHAWGKYAVTAFAFFLIYCWWDWETIGGALARSWAYVNLFLIDMVDGLVASFSPRPH
jgi:hypothetical protein